MRVDEFHYDLPPEAIARSPAEPRDAARLLVFDRGSDRVEHAQVRDLPEFLRRGDLLVVNDTRVLPHRLIGRRSSGGRVELLLLARQGEEAEGLAKPARKLRLGEPVWLEQGALQAVPLENLGAGRFRFRLAARDGDIDGTIERIGRAPLPPYIPRADSDDPAVDRERYQTLFARHPGAVAAPTAGLHFTPEILARLDAAGVSRASVTLHVGEGTFAPVRVDDVERHEMHAESYVLPPETATAVAQTRAAGGRVVAVGTTSARVLEHCATAARTVTAGAGETALFLYPGRPVRVVDALLTNFHLPGSTLLMLVATLTGTEKLMALYREAVAREYRFYSYGDAMLVL